MASCVYGIDSLAFSEHQESIIRKMGMALFDYPIKLIAYYALLQVFPFVSKLFRVRVYPKSIEDFFIRLMEDAIKLRLDSGSVRDDYLGYMLQLQDRKKLKSIDLAAHTVTFFLDGYETSSNVIAHVLYQLALNPPVQKRLREEIGQSLLRHDGVVTYDSMHEMTYLEQVMNGK